MIKEFLKVQISSPLPEINTVENSISGKIGKEWNIDHTDSNYNPLKPIRYNI